jgi:enamine deaminase RidA (YjgF/YER057c/UK114 family)
LIRDNLCKFSTYRLRNVDRTGLSPVFCPDLTLCQEFNEIYRTYFIKDFPARAFIGSGKLLFDAHFEMQGTAVKGGEAALKKKLPEPEAQHGN